MLVGWQYVDAASRAVIDGDSWHVRIGFETRELAVDRLLLPTITFDESGMNDAVHGWYRCKCLFCRHRETVSIAEVT